MGYFSDLLGTLRSTFRIGKTTLDASSVASTRTITLPNATGTLALTSDHAAGTLTGTTLASNVVTASIAANTAAAGSGLNFTAGSDTGGNGSTAAFKGGDTAIANRSGGTAQIVGGANTSGVSGTGGQARVVGGSGVTLGGQCQIVAGSPTNGTGGSVVIFAAAGVGTDKNGGSINLTPGAATGTGQPGYVVLNNSGSALATTATGGHTCIPTCAGTPTGTPGSIPTGTVPIVFDTTNHLFYIYGNSAWSALAPKTQPFDLPVFYPGVPVASAYLYRGKVTRDIAIPADFSGAYFTATANATASTVFDVQKNGSSIGSVTIGAGGTTPTFATSGGAAQSLTAGDVFAVIAPATPDVTLANPAITFAFTR